MEPQAISIPPTYTKENGIWALNIEAMALPKDFTPVEKYFIVIPPGATGGNHKHPRVEIFFGIGDLVLYWQTESGDIKKELFTFGKTMTGFVIPPHLPHAVKNESATESAVLFELANAPQHGVVSTQVIA